MTGWIIETLVATTLLMALVLALRGPVRRAFGPGMAYALWALPVLRMLLPPMPDAMLPLDVTPIGAATAPGTIMMMVPVADIPALPQGWGMSDVPVAVMACWAIGALGFVGYHLFSHSRFCARLRGQARRTTAIVGGRVSMIESDAASGPLAFGIWRKYVAFPADFEARYDELERDLALAHELGHHARGDLIANWAALAMLGFHWFNPVAWRAYRAFRADQEMACDALVLSDRHPALRHAYGRAIVKSAHGGAVSAACHLHSINEIKGRLRMLTKHTRPSRGRRIAGLAGIGALTLAGLAATASGTEAATELRAEVETRIGMPLDEIALPMPSFPAMPDIPAVAETPPAPPAVPMQVADMPEAPPAPPMPDLPAMAQVPAAPPAPAAPSAPGVPPVPPVPAVPPPGQSGQVYRVVKDGRTVILRRSDATSRAAIARLVQNAEGSRRQAERLARGIELQHIRPLDCGKGTGFVLNTREGGKQITTICTDRIELHAKRTADHALATGEFAKRTALMSLNQARRTIESQEGFTDEQRRDALAGIDTALAELRDPD